jgi:hypothetical protein
VLAEGKGVIEIRVKRLSFMLSWSALNYGGVTYPILLAIFDAFLVISSASLG